MKSAISTFIGTLFVAISLIWVAESQAMLSGKRFVTTKVSVDQVRPWEQARAFETYYGETVFIDEVEGISEYRGNVGDIMEKMELAVNSGNIITPDEIQFFHVKTLKKDILIESPFPKNGRIPKNDD